MSDQVNVNVTQEELLEIDRSARAYGWEVANGKPLTMVIETSEDNPFLNKDWRDKMED